VAVEAEVRAAGGVVWREGERGIEVVVLHRPRYDDWSLPKGKANEGESDEDCALREVQEETGLVCEFGPELASTSYLDARGRRKLVRYWSMLALDGSFTPHDEVDAVRWLPLAEAADVLSYDRDRSVLESFVATPGSTWSLTGE
jgi:8-oxo-dGTP diphosphatase